MLDYVFACGAVCGDVELLVHLDCLVVSGDLAYDIENRVRSVGSTLDGG